MSNLNFFEPAMPRNPKSRWLSLTQREPWFWEAGGLWLYGNIRLLNTKMACVSLAFGPDEHRVAELEAVERLAELLVLSGHTLVCGIHHAAHQRTAVIPLRWGSPRIVVVSGGFHHHLGENLRQEPFRLARLWRYQWDPQIDLAISRRAPKKLPTFARSNPTVDRLIGRVVKGDFPGFELLAATIEACT